MSTTFNIINYQVKKYEVSVSCRGSGTAAPWYCTGSLQRKCKTAFNLLLSNCKLWRRNSSARSSSFAARLGDSSLGTLKWRRTVGDSWGPWVHNNNSNSTANSVLWCLMYSSVFIYDHHCPNSHPHQNSISQSISKHCLVSQATPSILLTIITNISKQHQTTQYAIKHCNNHQHLDKRTVLKYC